MAGDAALVLKMEARLRDFERQMQRASKIADKSAADIEKRFSRINPKGFSNLQSGVNLAMAGLGKLGLAFSGAALAAKAFDAAGTFVNIQNRLRSTGLNGDALKSTFDELYAAAQRQGTPIEGLVTLYSRLSAAQSDLGVNSVQLVGFSEKIAGALKLGGVSAQEAEGALLQLSQALAGGKVQSEEFNSLLDGARPILQAVAYGIEEAGGSVGKLTALVKDGQVSSVAFFKGFEAGFPRLQQDAAGAQQTVGSATERINNAFVKLVGTFDQVAGATDIVVGAFNSLAKDLDDIPERVARVQARFQSLIDLYGQLKAAAKENLEVSIAQADAEARLQGLVGGPGRSPSGPARPPAAAAAAPAFNQPRRPITPTPIQTISLADNPVTGGSGKKGRGGGGGGGRAKTEDDFQREVAQYQRRTQLLQAETATVGQNTLAQERARAVGDLLNAAKEAGITVSDTIREKIDQEANAYGEAAQKLEDARTRIEQLNQFSEEFGSALNNAFTDAIVNGEKLDQVLQNLLKQLAQMAINSAFTSLFSSKNGGTSVFGTALANLLSFGGPRAAGGPVAGSKTYLVGEKGPELFVPGRSGIIVPNSVAAGAAGGSGGSIVVHQSNVWSGGFSEREKAEIIRAQRQATVVAVQEAMQRRKL